MKLNALKPTLREKKRYVCFKTEKDSLEDVKKLILSRVKKWVGEKNYSLGRVHFLKNCFILNENESRGIISCNHKQYIDVREGISLTEKVEVVYSSGTLKKAKEMLMR